MKGISGVRSPNLNNVMTLGAKDIQRKCRNALLDNSDHAVLVKSYYCRVGGGNFISK